LSLLFVKLKKCFNLRSDLF